MGDRMKNSFDEIMRQYPFIPEIFATLEAAVYFCDHKGRLVYINPVAEQLDGYTNAEIHGRTVMEAYGLNENTSPMLRALTTGKPVVDMAFRYFINGREIFQICNARPVFMDGNKVGAFYGAKGCHQTDGSDRKKHPSAKADVFAGNRRSRGWGETDLTGIDRLVGEHPLFLECKEMAKIAARRDSPVLLIGETGSGKETICPLYP